MALVCDYKSDEVKPESESGDQNNEDLEDGEIEDDEEEENKPEVEPVVQQPPEQQQQQLQKVPEVRVPPQPMDTKFREEKERLEKKKHDKKHLTEAEKSVMRLHKLERLEREKRDKYRREQVCLPPIEPEEDFATSLEKAIAKVLKKDKPEDEKEEGIVLPEVIKKGKKRKRKDKHNKKNKKNKQESANEDLDDSEMLNMRGGSPDRERTPPALVGSPKTEEEYDSESSSNKSSEGTVRKEKRKHGKRAFNRDRKFQDRTRERSRDREKRTKTVGKRNTGICLYYLQGLCEDEACPYSHESVQPMKLELCKFYLLECCAKGDKCLYMHSDFPCKFYHTGIPCQYGDGCKFAHGGPLSDGLKQILFKHIETAPKEILGNFPRLSRENASLMILQAQKNLDSKHGSLKKDKDQDSGKNDIPSLFELNFSNTPDSQSDGDGKKENKRNRPSRWQDPDPSDKGDKHNSPLGMGFGMKGGFKDQDMRINSNGDVDMRTMNQPMIHTTNIVNPNILVQQPPPMMGPPPGVMQPILLPNILAQTPPNLLPSLLQQSGVGNQLQGVINSTLLNPNLLAQNTMVPPPSPIMQSDNNIVDIEKYKMEAAGMSKGGPDVSMLEASRKDTDIRQLDFGARDTDIRHLNKNIRNDDDDDENESGLQIVMDDESKTDEKTPSYIDSLPKTQRELYKRILSQQKEKTFDDNQQDPDNDNDQNIDWYSDDEDDNKLTIKDDFEDSKLDDDAPKEAEPAPVKPLEVMEKLGDLSKIDISAEVTKLLTTISQQPLSFTAGESKQPDPRHEIRDPRLSTETRDPRQAERKPGDPRKTRMGSTEERSVSIYEQGCIVDVGKDIDLRSGDKDLRPQFGDSDFRAGSRPDVDLRQLNIPFKAMQNYTPATEIDASINSHPPLPWKVYTVEVPKPDYTGLKLSATDAQTTGDPRLRKIFRLSTEEKDSPASPKESPKASSMPTARVDPRRKKMESEQQAKPQLDTTCMTYTQQLTMLQSSPFYKSLTSNQKVMLNQELASRNDQSGMSDPIITAMLQNLGLISPVNQNPGGHSQAMHILATTMGGPPNFGQGLLGAGPPNIPNLPPDFPMNFDPRNGGMLPGVPPPFANFIPPPPEANNFGGFNDDFYPEQGGTFNGNNGGNNRDNRGFRDRPRRGRMNNRNNNRNFFRRHNRNRNSPP